MAMFNATLTLPGIAGFMLTIGAAVDANVLINERIREEIRRGRRLIDAVETGYHEASRAIFDANVTHVISAAIMAYFGSGPVRGFAVVLLIGIVTSVFTAVYFTRMLVALWIRRARPRATPYLRPRAMKLLKLVPDHTNIDFMRWRNLALVLSLIATVASIAFTVYRGLNLGVDFVGGQMIRVDFAQPIDVERAARRGRRGCASAKPASRSSAAPKTFQIRLPKPQGARSRRERRRRRSVKPRSRQDYPGARVDAGRIRFGQGQRGAGAGQRDGDRASRCSASRSTSGSASNGSSASARC